MQLNTASFYGKIAPFESACIHANQRVLHNGNRVFCCYKSQINHDIMQLYMQMCPLHAADGLVLMQAKSLHVLSRLHFDQAGWCNRVLLFFLVHPFMVVYNMLLF